MLLANYGGAAGAAGDTAFQVSAVPPSGPVQFLVLDNIYDKSTNFPQALRGTGPSVLQTPPVLV